MKKTLFARLSGLLLAFASTAAVAQTVQAPSSWTKPSLSPSWYGDWNNLGNWTGGAPNAAGAIGWLNFDINPYLNIADHQQQAQVPANQLTTGDVTLNFGVPVNNSLSVTDGSFYWSQSKGSNSTSFIVEYTPGTTKVKVSYTATSTSIRNISIAYASTVPGNATELLAFTDNVHTTFSKVLSNAPDLNKPFSVGDQTYFSDYPFTQSFDDNGLTASFQVTYNPVTRVMTVTYDSTAHSVNSGGTPRTISVTYTSAGAMAVTLGTLGIGDPGQNVGLGEFYGLRLNSLTMDNNGAQANIIKSNGFASDEIASGLHLAGPLALAVRTGGDQNTSFRISGNIDGTGALIKADSGNFNLTGNNTFSGPMIFRDTGGAAYLRSGLTLLNCATTNGSTTVTCTSTLGLSVGMTISGPNIQPNTAVTSVDPNGTTFTISPAATGTATLQTLVAKNTTNIQLTNCATTFNSRIITCDSTTGLAPGMVITGANVTVDAVVTSVASSTSFTISTGATGTGSGLIMFGRAGSPTFSTINILDCAFSSNNTNSPVNNVPANSVLVNCDDTTGLQPGMVLSTTDPSALAAMQPNSVITAVLSPTRFTFSPATINNNNGTLGMTLTATARAGYSQLSTSGTVLLPTLLETKALPQLLLEGCKLSTSKTTTVTCQDTSQLVVGMKLLPPALNYPANTVLTIKSITDGSNFVVDVASINSNNSPRLTYTVLPYTTTSTVAPNNPKLVVCADTSPLVPGMVVFGTGASATVFPTTPPFTTVNTVPNIYTFTVNNNATSTGFASGLSYGPATTAGSSHVYCGNNGALLQPGMTVSGTNIPANAVISTLDSAVNGKIIGFSLNKNATASAVGGTLSVGPVLTSGSSTVTVYSTSGLAPGMVVTGTGIPANTVITSVGNFSFVMSQAATASSPAGGTSTDIAVTPAPGLSLANATYTAGGTTVTLANGGSTAGLAVGTLITGLNIPENTYVTAVTDGTHFTISSPALAAGSNQLLQGMASQGMELFTCNAAAGATVITCASTTGLGMGSLVTGSGMPDNAIVMAVNSATQFTISSPTTAAVTDATLLATAGGYTISNYSVSVTNAATNGTATVTLSGGSTTTGLVVGMGVTGTNMPAGAVITQVTDSTHFNINPVASGTAGSLTLTALATTFPVSSQGLALTGGSTTLNSTTVTVASVTGLSTGMVVAGPGLPKRAVVVSINTSAKTFVISAPAPASLSAQSYLASDARVLGIALVNAATTSGSTTIKCASTVGLSAGLQVTGTNGLVPANAVITSVTDANSFVINVPATGTSSVPLTLLAALPDGLIIAGPCSTTAGSKIVGCASTAGLALGMVVTGPGMPTNAVITQLSAAVTNQFGISSNATATAAAVSLMATSIPTLPILACDTTAGTNIVTCATSAGLTVGQAVTGDGIPSGTTVTGLVDDTHFSISANANATATGLTLVQAAILPKADVVTTRASTYNGNLAVKSRNTTGMVVGMSVVGTNIPAGAAVAAVLSRQLFLISLPAQADGWGLTLAVGTNAISSTQIELGTANRDGNSSFVLQLAAANQINDQAVLHFDGASSRNPYLRTEGYNETVGGIIDYTSNGVIENTESENGVFTNSVLTLNTTTDYEYNGFFRNKSGGDSTGMIGLAKLGTGAISLSGGNISYTGDTNILGGSLRLTNTTNFGSNMITAATGSVELSTTSDWQMNQIVAGSGSLIKSGINQVTLGTDSTFTGATVINGGTLRLSAALISETVGTQTGGITTFTRTLGRFPSPGSIFVQETDTAGNASQQWREASATGGLSGANGVTGPNAWTVTYNKNTRLLTITYPSNYSTGGTSRNIVVSYRPADTERVGNTNGTTTSFTVSLPSKPKGNSLYVTDGVNLWQDNGTTGTVTPANAPFTIDYKRNNTPPTVTVTYSGAPAYGRTITAVWATDEGLTNTSSITLNNATLLIDNQASGGSDVFGSKPALVRQELNSTNRINDTAAIISNGGFLTFRSNAGTDNYSEKLGALNLVSGFLSVGTQPSATTNTSTLTFGSLSRVAGSGATVLFNGNRLGTGDRTNTLTFSQVPSPASVSSPILGGWALAQDGSIPDFAMYDANTGSIRALPVVSARNINAVNNWVAVSGGGANSLGYDVRVTGSPTAGTKDAVVDTLTITGSGAINVNMGAKRLTVNAGGIIFAGNTGGTAHQITNGTLTAGAVSGYELDLWTINQAQTNTITSQIINNPAANTSTINGGLTLVKSGPGEVRLAPASGSGNLYSGGTRINGGDIDISALSSLGTLPGNSDVSLKSDFLVMNNGALQVTFPTGGNSSDGTITFTPHYGVTLGIGGGAFVPDPNMTVNVQSPITGPGGLTVGSTTVANQFSGGTLVLSGDNSFQGTLQAILGTLVIAGGSNSFTGGINISAVTGTIDVQAGSALPFEPTLKISGGRFYVGSNARLGALTGIDGSVIGLDDGGQAGSTPIMLTINQAANTTYAGQITDGLNNTLGITKKGMGVLTLTLSSDFSFRSDYRGPTIISEGVIAASFLNTRGRYSSIGAGNDDRATGSASSLVIENGAGLSYVGTTPSFTNRAFTIGVGGLGAGVYANGVGNANIVYFSQDDLFHYDSVTGLQFDGRDLITFNRPNEAATLNLGGRNLGDNTFAMDLHDNTSGAVAKPLALQKSGDGNWVLGQNLGYTNVITLTGCSVGLTTGFSPTATIVTCDSTAGLVPGMYVYGDPAIKPGITVAAVKDSHTFVLSEPATALIAGPVTLTAVADSRNDFTGNTVIYLGTLALEQNGSLGAATGASFTLSNCVTSAGSATVTCTSTSGLVAGMALKGPNIAPGTFVRAITSATAFTMDVPATTTASGFSLQAIGGGVVQLIGGNLDLRGVNYTSSKILTMDGGRLRALVGSSYWAGPVNLDVSATVEVGPGASLDLAGGVAGRVGLTKVGFGTLILEGTNTFTGGMNVNEGTLQLNYTNNKNGKLADNGTLTLGGGRKGATLDIVGNAAGNTETVFQAVLSLGLNRVTRSDPNSGTVARLNNFTINQGATLDVAYDTRAVLPKLPGTNTDINRATASTDKANDVIGGNSTGILGSWATVNLSDWASNNTNGNDGSIVPYSAYLTNTWGGLTSNATITASTTQTNASTYSLRYASTTPTITTLVGNNTLRGGGILQAPSAGAVNNIITGGTLVLGNNLQGGNLVIQQNDTEGSLQIFSNVANAPDINLHNAWTYFQNSNNANAANTNVNNRIALPLGLLTTDYYTGMLVTGPNVRPGSTINGINSNTAITVAGATQNYASFNISQNLASVLTFGQGTAASPPPQNTFTASTRVPLPSTYVANTRVQAGVGINNQIHLVVPPTYPLIVGQTVTGVGIPADTVIIAVLPTTPAGTDYLLSRDVASGINVSLTFDSVKNVNNQVHISDPGILSSMPLVAGMLVTGPGIPDGTVISSVVSTVPTATSTAPAGVDILLNNDVPQQTDVQLTFQYWGEMTINNATVGTIIKVNNVDTPVYQLHLSVGTTTATAPNGSTVGFSVGQSIATGNLLGLPAGSYIAGFTGTTDIYYAFPTTRTLTIGSSQFSVDLIQTPGGGSVTHGMLMRLRSGNTTQLTIGTPVSGPDIQPGTVVNSFVGNGTDFYISRSVLLPVVDITIQSRNGVLKTGDGIATLGGNNTFSGPVTITGGTLSVTQVTNGGQAGTLGASTIAAGNITISGGTLQYTGDSAAVNRGFTINEVGAIDVAYAGSTLNFTGNLSGGTGAALGTLQKVGPGTLQLSRTTTLGGATNFGGFEVNGGTLQLKYNNPNDGSPNDRFAATTAAVTLGGGKLELVGVQDTPAATGNTSEDRIQNLKGQFTVNTGASQVWATGARGSAITLNLQDPAVPTDVIRAAGGTVLFVENPGPGSNSAANITLAVNSIDTGVPVTWATYQDTSVTSQPGVNNFAAIEPADGGLISADSTHLYTTTSDVSSWRSGQTVTESGTPFSGTLSLGTGVYAVRFFAKANGVVNITDHTSPGLSGDTQDNLILEGGAILAAFNSGNFSKVIQGGQITSGLQNLGTSSNDLIIHNYNPAHPLEIKSEIIDNKFATPIRAVNLVITGTGTTELYGNDLSTSPTYLKNTYTGTTFLTGGVLELANPWALTGGIGLNGVTTITFTGCGTTTGSKTVICDSTIGMFSGMALSGINLAAGTAVDKVISSTSFTITQGALAGASGTNPANNITGVVGASNLNIKGGQLGFSNNANGTPNIFGRALGTGPSQVQWTGDGGFTAYGTTDVTVTLSTPQGGVNGTLIWGADGFVPDSSVLKLSSVDATASVRLTNPINLGGVGRTVDVADGAAATDAELAGGLSGNGGSLRKTGQGTLRISGGNGTQTGGANLAQGKLSTSAASLGTGPLGIGSTDSTNATDSLVLELRGGTFGSTITVGNKNSSAVTSINAIASPTLNGDMVLDRHIFFGPSSGRKITIGGSLLDSLDASNNPTGHGGLTVVDGGSVVLNDVGTLGADDVSGAAINGSVVLRSGTLALGNSAALGTAVVEMNDVAATKTFTVDRSTAGRSLLALGGIYDPRSSGRPGTNQGSGGFIFNNQSTLTIDGKVYTEKDSLLDGVTPAPGDPSHKRTLIMVDGEASSPDENGLYELVYSLGASTSLSNCSTLMLTSTIGNCSTSRLNPQIYTTNSTSGLVVGMRVAPNGTTITDANTKIDSIIDAHTFTISPPPAMDGTSVTLSLSIGSTVITCQDTSSLDIGMPVVGSVIPVGAVVNSIIDGQNFTISQPVTAAATNLLLTARLGDAIGLNRISEFDEASEMTYGTRVFVTNGTYAGKTFFLAANVTISYDESFNPRIPYYTATLWKQDTLNGSVALLANTSGLDIGNDIDVNRANGTGSMTLGGSSSLSSGTSSFSGDITLQGGTVELDECSTNTASTDPKTVQVLGGTGTAGLAVGMRVSGPNIAAGAVVTSVPSGSTFTMSLAPTGTGASLTLFATYPASTSTVRLVSDTLDGPGIVFKGTLAEAAGSSSKLAVQKLGTGIVTLTGTNTYTGGTSITSGTLIVNGGGVAGSGTGSGAVLAQNFGSTLGGTGRIAGDVTLSNGAILSPGDTGASAFNTLTLGGDLTMTTGASGLFGIHGNDYDTVNVAGRLSMDDSVVLRFLLQYVPTGATFFDVLSWSNLTGDILNQLDLPALVDNTYFWDPEIFNGNTLRLNLDLRDSTTPPVARFAVHSAHVRETSGQDIAVTVSVQLDAPSSNNINIPLILGGTATEDALAANADYSIRNVDRSTGALSGTNGQPHVVHFDPGQTSADVRITVHDDPYSEPTETLTLSFVANEQFFFKGSPGTFTLTIDDNDGNFPAGTLWTLQNPHITNERLQGIATGLTSAGVATTVVVGSNGKILLSSDSNISDTDPNLNAWTAQPIGISTSLNAVALRPSTSPSTTPLFVAVGDGGVIVTSSDGQSWTYHSTTGDKNLRTVIFEPTLGANGTFITAGDDGVIYTSTDGFSWTYANSGLAGSINSLVYGNLLFVAVGDNGAVSTSADGILWTPGTTGTLRNLRSITYKTGQGFVAVGDSGQALTSANGTTWTSASVGSGQPNLRTVFLNAGTFYAAGLGGTAWVSSTGTTWTQVSTVSTLTSEDLLAGGVPAGSNKSFLVGAGGIMLINTSGSQWGRSAVSSGPTTEFDAATFNGNMLVVGGLKGQLATGVSTDNFIFGVPAIFNSGTIGITGLAGRPNGQVLAVADNGNSYLSQDGSSTSTWTTITTPAGNVPLRGITFVPGTSPSPGAYYAVGDGGNIIVGTINDTTHTVTWASAASNVTKDLRAIASSGSLWLAVGPNGTILSSADGLTWDDISPSGLPALTDVVWTGTQFIITGIGGTLLTTPDGISLTKQVTSTSADLNGVVWTTSGGFAVGNGGTIIGSSADGFTWAPLSSGTSRNLKAISWSSSSGRLVAVGASGTILTSDIIFRPPPSVFFAQSDMTVDERVGTALLPINFTQLPTTDLYISFSAVGSGAHPATVAKDFSFTTPFKISVASLTAREVADGAFVRYLPIPIVGDAIKNEGDEQLTVTLKGFTDSKGNPLKDSHGVVLDADHQPAELIDPKVLTLTITDTVAPTITFDPAVQHQVVPLGGTTTLTTLITGSNPTITWLKSGAVVPKATAGSYTITNATTASAGTYTVKAVNPAGTATTNAGHTAPDGTVEVVVIDQSDKLVLVKSGTSTILTATAGGAGLSYQWYKDATPLSSDGTNYVLAGAKLTIKNVTAGGNEGDFHCTITQNGAGHATGTTGDTGVFHVRAAVLPDITAPFAPRGRVGAFYSLQIPRASSADPLSPSTPASYTATGLPAGLSISSTGLISGTPTAAYASGKAVTIKATNAAGTTTIGTATNPFIIYIDPIDPAALGSFVALVDRSGSLTVDPLTNLAYGTLGLGARLDLTTTAAGTVTAKLTVGPTPYSATGKLVTTADGDPSPHNPQGTISFNRGAGKSVLTLTFSIDPATSLLTGTVSDNLTGALLNGWRNMGPTTASLVNFIADVPGGPPSDGSQPEGVSYAGITIAATGTTAVNGKTADGSAILTSGYFGPSGQVLVYQSLYAATAPGTFSGILSVDTSSATLPLTGSPTWSHPKQPSGRTYLLGWSSPLSLSAFGGKYYPPVTVANGGTGIVMNLPDNGSALDKTNAELLFTGGNIAASSSPNPSWFTFQIAAPAKVVPPASNPAATSLTITPATGLFTGTFTLTDADPTSPAPPAKPKPNVVRKVTYQGIIIPNLQSPDAFDGLGYGYFLLPKLPDNTVSPATTTLTSPILSGFVNLQAH